MATPREQFERVAGGATVVGIPDWPKLPKCLLKRLSEEEKKEVEEYEDKVAEFFKQDRIRNGGL